MEAESATAQLLMHSEKVHCTCTYMYMYMVYMHVYNI